jgi:predicted nucleotidyltransferase
VNRHTSLHRLDAGDRRQVRERLRDVLAADSQVMFAFVFGSFAEDRPFHDIDVGIYVNRDRGASADVDLPGLETRLSAVAGFPVDLVVLNDRPVTFLYHVFRGEVLVARDEAQLIGILEKTMRLYFDIAPLLRQATREAFAT